MILSNEPPAFDHVVMLSVDGLHAKVLQPPLIEQLPTFSRLLRGPHTLEARTDADATITLPNHVSMITSLPLAKHAWQWNEDPPAARHGGTIHARAGRYIPSVFDVAHDRGIATAIFVGKTKFWLLEQSYGDGAGGKDETAPNDGKAKIDVVTFAERGADVVGQCSAWLTRSAVPGHRTLSFLHLAEPDAAGHSQDWDLTPGSKYMKSIEVVDRALGELLAAIDGDERLRGRVAIILTTDHGGGQPKRTHTDITAPCNFVIPFAVWLGNDRAPLDLYAINAATRTRPAPEILPEVTAFPPPIRHGEMGNVALQLLGLPSIPDSVHNVKQDLVLEVIEPHPAAIPQAGPRFADDPSGSSKRRSDTPWIEQSDQSSSAPPR